MARTSFLTRLRDRQIKPGAVCEACEAPACVNSRFCQAHLMTAQAELDKMRRDDVRVVEDQRSPGKRKK
jgi:hypothetical protein